jgi:hypothetical protein
LRANCIIGIFAPRHTAAGQILIGRYRSAGRTATASYPSWH